MNYCVLPQVNCHILSAERETWKLVQYSICMSKRNGRLLMGLSLEMDLALMTCMVSFRRK